jgi:hypothetical protein
MRKLKPVLLLSLVLVVYVLHQDFWNWRRAYPLIFGFLPIGLAYHAAYSVLAALMMAILVRSIWPRHLESTETGDGGTDRREAAGGRP